MYRSPLPPPVTDPVLRRWALDEISLVVWRTRRQEAPEGPCWSPVTARHVPDPVAVTDTRDRLALRWGI